MKTHSVNTTKTGRYFTFGELNKSTTEIVFAFHGYAQLAADFIKNFESINTGKRFIIAPEGLNKFYFKGFSGKPSASWMTKEDRENEIKDYLHFFNIIYSKYSQKLNDNIIITLFGFSQGGAAASRWFVKSDLPNSKLILWGSSLPTDVDYDLLREKNTSPIKIIIGDEDEFISSEFITKEIKRLEKEKVSFELKKYPGKHNVQPGLFKELNLFE